MLRDSGLTLLAVCCLVLGATVGATAVSIFGVKDTTEWATAWGGLIGSLLGAAATITAGVVAWLAAKKTLEPVEKQLREMRQQSAATAHAAVSQSAEAIEKEAALVAGAWTIERDVLSICSAADDPPFEDQWWSEFMARAKALHGQIAEFHSEAQRYSARHPETDELNVRRIVYSDALRNQLIAMSNLIGAATRMNKLRSQEDLGLYFNFSDLRTTGLQLRKRLSEFQIQRAELTSALEPAVNTAWEEVNRLERLSLGDPR